MADIKTPTEVIHGNGPLWAVPPFLKTNFPEVDAFVRPSFQTAERKPATALTEPFSVVISETTAKKYFARNDVVGQTLLITNDAS